MAGAARDELLCSWCRRAFKHDRAPRLIACQHHFCLDCARTALACGPDHEARALRAELRELGARRRELVLRALRATAALQQRLEAELARDEPVPTDPVHLRARRDLALQRARLDDAVRTAPAPLDAAQLRRAHTAPADCAPADSGADEPDPLVFLANYCLSTLYGVDRAPAGVFPLLFFELEVDGARWGRVVVEARADVAPRMARNFEALAVGAGGVGYRGCAVFQAWGDESVITGDVELNNGRGGRAGRGPPFLPDDSRLSAVRGAVGMRRSQKRHDNLGLVASQFRIVLREMRGFTAIFGHVAEGLELVDRLSRTGDTAGKPRANIVIADCGRLN